jgi:NAD(P)-dependent dehydrogenase (short-subunit alcohol dehydrogenase family)
MNVELKKRVFVTGCTRGIGQAISKHFQDLGAYVIGTGTSPNKPDWVDQYEPFDFSKMTSLRECSAFVSEIKPEILINNAGMNRNYPFLEIPTDLFSKIQQVNLLAPMLLSQAAIPAMLQANWGRIVNISSIWGIISKEYRASYSASKFALDGLTVAISAEYAKFGILANCVSPGFTDTELTSSMLKPQELSKILEGVPIGRLAQPFEVAKLVGWLASEENSYVTGQSIAIDGGFTRA